MSTPFTEQSLYPPMDTFFCSYDHDGDTWGFHFKARDFEDAQARLAHLAQGKVIGILLPENCSPPEAATTLTCPHCQPND